MTTTASSRLRGAPAPAPSRMRRTFAASLEAVGSFDSIIFLTPVLRQQWLVMFVSVVAVVAIVAGLYLDITSRAAIVGRDIQNMEIAIAANQRANADLQTQLAGQFSDQALQARAEALGYQPLTRAEIDYILVPAYPSDHSLHLTAENPVVEPVASQPAFQQSLLEWFAQQLESASAPLSQ